MSDEHTGTRKFKALSHPLRARLVTAWLGRLASPSEIADELAEPLPQVVYHVKTLVELGMLELVEERQRRGAIEHFYRLTDVPWVSTTEYAALTRSQRGLLMRTVLTEVADDVRGAFGGEVRQPSDVHVSRSPLLLDARAWAELAGQLLEVTRFAYALARESSERSDREDLVPARLVLMQFEAAARGQRRREQ